MPTTGKKRPSLGAGGAPVAKKRSLEDFFGNPADGLVDIPQEAQTAVTIMGEWLYAPQDNRFEWSRATVSMSAFLLLC